MIFLCGFAVHLHTDLLPLLRKACLPSGGQADRPDPIFLAAYLPAAYAAGAFIQQRGLKKGIVLGLLLFSLGALLVSLGAGSGQAGLLLPALFVFAGGLAFLETAAPVGLWGGPPNGKATFRLNLAYSFHGLAATLAPYSAGAYLVARNAAPGSLQPGLPLTETAPLRLQEPEVMQQPYLALAVVALSAALLVRQALVPQLWESKPGGPAPRSLWKEGNLVRGLVALFCYSGVQAGTAGFFIRYTAFAAGMHEKVAALFLSAALFVFMLGRFAGTLLLRYFPAPVLLLSYSLFGLALLGAAVLYTGMAGIGALVALQFFLSLMYPTIVSLSLPGLGTKTPKAASFLVLSAAGGAALLPAVMGRVAGLFGPGTAFVVPLACLGAVSYFALRLVREKAGEKTALAWQHP
ncbi:glucose/galactose MFS transporter [Paraflavisolibacter sp. H34]